MFTPCIYGFFSCIDLFDRKMRSEKAGEGISSTLDDMNKKMNVTNSGIACWKIHIDSPPH